jgi:ADP-ribose pyrophosphatase
VHPGETPEQAAHRELREEAGWAAGRLDWVSSYLTSKSVCDETAHLYVAHDLTRASAPADDTEFLEVATFPFGEVLRMVLACEIRDSMTVIAVLLAERERRGAPQEA